jgi:hypothetical protein
LLYKDVTQIWFYRSIWSIWIVIQKLDWSEKTAWVNHVWWKCFLKLVQKDVRSDQGSHHSVFNTDNPYFEQNVRVVFEVIGKCSYFSRYFSFWKKNCSYEFISTVRPSVSYFIAIFQPTIFKFLREDYISIYEEYGWVF